MKKSLLISGMFVAATLVSQSALAEVKIRAGAGASSYKLGGDYTGATSDYTSTNLGLTFAADNGFYVDLAGSSGSGKHDGWATANSPTTICGGTSCGNTASADEDFKRNDYALIAGKSFLNPNNGIAVTFYGGYKGGTTTLGAQNAGLLWTEEKFDTQGLVFGGGASFPIAQGRAGAVGVNLGLGLMSAKWTDNNGFSVKSKTAVGVSLGASYTYPITSNFGVIADYKANSYSYNFGDTANPFTVNETFSTLGGSLYVKF